MIKAAKELIKQKKVKKTSRRVEVMYRMRINEMKLRW